MDIISHSGTIIESVDAGAGADKAMQINSGIVMKLKLSKAAKGSFYANELLYSLYRVHYSLVSYIKIHRFSLH